MQAKSLALLSAVVASTFAASWSTAAVAGTIPYPNPGTTNNQTCSFTAANTGDLSAYTYVLSSAGDNESLGLLVNGFDTGQTGLNDHTSAAGTRLDFGTVVAGSALTFYIRDFTTGLKFFSDPSLNPNGENHVYSTDYAGGSLVPAGTYVGFEDTPFNRNSDKNYADLQFVFTNTATQIVGAPPNPVPAPTTPVPEPTSMALLGMGMVGLAAVRRRAQNNGA